MKLTLRFKNKDSDFVEIYASRFDIFKLGLAILKAPFYNWFFKKDIVVIINVNENVSY